MGTRNGLSRQQAGTHRMWPIDSTRWGFRVQSAHPTGEEQGLPEPRVVNQAQTDPPRLRPRRPQHG